MPAECSVVKGIGAEWAEDVRRLLSHSYWAYDRSLETVERSMRGSVCYGAMCGKNLVGFARIVTDGATTAYLCDVIV
ncbi:MAG: N-acetyltransferase, partial [Oscillospiraceae bacterium]